MSVVIFIVSVENAQLPITSSLKETVDVHKVAAFIEPSMKMKYVPA